MRNLKIVINYNVLTVILCVICFFTNLSQMPYFVENGLTRYISLPLWFIFFIVIILKNIRINLKKIKIPLYISFLLAIFIIIFGLVNEKYFASDIYYCVFLSFFVFFIGTTIGDEFDKKNLLTVLTSYILSGLIVGINVFFSYIYGNSLNGRIYLYSSKNSVSQIIFSTFILILFLKLNGKKKIINLFYLGSFIFLLYILIALKSRATLISIPIIFILILIYGKKNRRLQITVILLLISIILLLIFNENMFDVLINDVLLGGRDSNSISAISSGRSDEWINFTKDISGNCFFGMGKAKRESLILTSILEYGIFMGGLIIFLALYPTIWGIRHINKKDVLYLVFISISISYFINGIFEQLAPFGPGVKCYLLWLLFGIIIGNKKLTKGGIVK